MDFPLPIPDALRTALPGGTSVLVALSGGVDSSVALALLHALGCEVTAVTFKNFCYGEEKLVTEKSCCSEAAVSDARRIAQRFQVPHWVTDVTDRFRALVIEPFVREYSMGRTPNPCLSCNASVRFPQLVHLADQLGAAFVATGHYARLERRDGDLVLLQGVDSRKDQAYFLYRVDRALFPRITFPLGWYRKEQVRAAARLLDLPVASKHDSQEICFVPGGDRTFLFREPAACAEGEIVDARGRLLGRHRGLVHYTVGQRRGLGIAASQPLYVLSLDRQRNRLVVGPERELGVRRITCDDFQPGISGFPCRGPGIWQGRSCVARIRHRHAGAPVQAWRLQGDTLEVELAAEVRGAAPGQALVLYHAEQVLGGGRIRRTA